MVLSASYSNKTAASKRCGLCQADQPRVTQLVEDTDDKLFQSVLHNPEHTLYQLLPERRHDITYCLQPRT